MTPVTPHGNALHSKECHVDRCHVRMDRYNSFTNITVAIGEARHFAWANRTPVGEFGMLHASSTNKKFHDPNDQYVQVDDIIQYLIDRKDQVTATSASGNDPITKDQSWSALPKGY